MPREKRDDVVITLIEIDFLPLFSQTERKVGVVRGTRTHQSEHLVDACLPLRHTGTTVVQHIPSTYVALTKP